MAAVEIVPRDHGSGLIPAEPFVSIPLWKITVLSTMTFSLYDVVWFYKQWKRQRSVEHCSPFWRAVFGVLFFPVLGLRIRERRKDLGLAAGFSVAAVSISYFLFQLVSRLPDPWWLLGFLSVLPLLVVQHRINQLNWTLGDFRMEGFGAPAWCAAIVGALITLLVLFGMMLSAAG